MYDHRRYVNFLFILLFLLWSTPSEYCDILWYLKIFLLELLLWKPYLSLVIFLNTSNIIIKEFQKATRAHARMKVKTWIFVSKFRGNFRENLFPSRLSTAPTDGLHAMGPRKKQITWLCLFRLPSCTYPKKCQIVFVTILYYNIIKLFDCTAVGENICLCLCIIL